MAHFIAPTSGNINADYFVDNKMATGSIGRMIVPPGGEADIILGWCPDELAVRSNNPNVVANPIPSRPFGQAGGRILTIKPIAKEGGTYIDFGVINPDGWSWAPGSPWPGHVLVNVGPRQAPTAPEGLVKLTGATRALNSTDTPVPYVLGTNSRISTSASPEAVISAAMQQGRLNHLVFSCHGHVIYEDHKVTDSIINMGTGLNRANVELFSGFGKMRGGVIWCCGCAIGNDNELNVRRARLSGCFFVAPVMYMQIKPGGPKSPPQGMIDMLRRFLPKVWTPDGELITWDFFVKEYGKKLGFAIV